MLIEMAHSQNLLLQYEAVSVMFNEVELTNACDPRSLGIALSLKDTPPVDFNGTVWYNKVDGNFYITGKIAIKQEPGINSLGGKEGVAHE